MRVQLDEIREQGLIREYECEASALPELAILEESGELKFHRPLRIALKFSRLDQLIEASGEISTTLELACGRCLNVFDRPVTITFEVTFSNEPLRIHDEFTEDDEEGTELTADELGLIPFHGNEIDLDETIQEQVLLALPLRPLCRTDCRGLCPQCGVDRNRETCSCTPPELERVNKFAALKDLKIER